VLWAWVLARGAHLGPIASCFIPFPPLSPDPTSHAGGFHDRKQTRKGRTSFFSSVLGLEASQPLVRLLDL